jgi:hypothetical protein
VISARSIIAKASSNGTQRIASSSLASGAAGPWLTARAVKIQPVSSVTEFDRSNRTIGRQSSAVTPVSSRSSRRPPASGVSGGGTPPSGISHE